MPNKKNQFPSEKIYQLGCDIADTLCVYDMIPPDTGEWKKFRLFLELLDYCTRRKMYAVRDQAIRKLILALSD